MHCLYLMSLNLSNLQIAQELGLNKDDVQKMTQQLRETVDKKRPDVSLEGEVECDEVYVVSGHKGHPDAVKKKAVKDGGTGSEVPVVAALWKKKSLLFLA